MMVPPSVEMGGRPARILVVDDERDNRELLDLILGWEGFVVLSANDGEQALAAVASDAPDLLLLDVMMPGMDGYEVASRLKGDATTHQIPIIIVTALADTNDAKARGCSAGAEGFLAKPIDRDSLLRVVKAMFRTTYPGYQE